MIHRALLKLLFLQFRAVFRWMFRGGRKLRTILFIVVGGGLLALWLIGAIVQHFTQPRPDPGGLRLYLPATLLTVCIANLISAAGERAIAFTPAETDLLFPGPFTRRELLLYKIIKGAAAGTVSAAVFATVLWSYAPLWIVAYAGCFLAMLFLQLFSISIMLVAMNISERVLNRVRRGILFGVVILLAFAAEPIIAGARSGDRHLAVEGLRQSAVIRGILKPFDVFANIITAPQAWPDAAMWIGVALGMLGVLLAVVMLLDAQYMEASAAAGRRRYEMIQRARTRGFATKPTGARLRAPMLPRLAGIGPIAWRQLTTALRQSRGLLTLLLMIAIGAGVFVFTQSEDRHPLRATGGVVLWASIMLANSLRFDFRGDIDTIDALKTLPVNPIAICAGEIVAPSLVMSLFHWTIITMAAIAVPGYGPWLLAAAVVVLPMNLVLFSIENLMFLLFPTRFSTAAPGDLQGSGRMMLVMFLKMILTLIVVASAAGIGAIVQLFSGSMLAGVLSALVILVIEIIALLTAMSYAFARFDPHIHTPA